MILNQIKMCSVGNFYITKREEEEEKERIILYGPIIFSEFSDLLIWVWICGHAEQQYDIPECGPKILPKISLIIFTAALRSLTGKKIVLQNQGVLIREKNIEDNVCSNPYFIYHVHKQYLQLIRGGLQILLVLRHQDLYFLILWVPVILLVLFKYKYITFTKHVIFHIHSTLERRHQWTPFTTVWLP